MSETPPTPAPAPAPGAWEKEPVAIALSGLVAAVVAALGVASAYDWIDMTADQVAATGAALTAITAAVGAVLRAAVYSPATVARRAAP